MNLPTIITLGVLILILGLIVRNMYKKKKEGKSITGCASCEKDCVYRQ